MMDAVMSETCWANDKKNFQEHQKVYIQLE
jgi:hypothetical protein